MSFADVLLLAGTCLFLNCFVIYRKTDQLYAKLHEISKNLDKKVGGQ